MTDAECVRFLQWALPRLGLRWQGFRKVRRQVCEEPYSLVLAAAEAGIEIHVVATDVDSVLLERARRASYGESSLRDLPGDLRARAFDDGRLRPEYREPVEFLRHDVRDGAPGGPFDVALAGTSSSRTSPTSCSGRLVGTWARSLRAGGTLLVGVHEALPEGLNELEPWPAARGVYRYRPEQRTKGAGDAEDRRL